MQINLHTHTKRCHHASGEDREYIESAIKSGIKILGFSDHAPFDKFGGGHHSGFRVDESSADEYRESLSSLRNEYENKVKIHIGFEMEYYPSYFSSMLETAIDYGAEYLILGQHFVSDETTDIHSMKCGESIENLQKYVSNVVKAIESGVFTYIAHPDMVNFTGDIKTYQDNMAMICKAASENKVPLELNLYGFRDKRNYPNSYFWELCSDFGCDVVFGIDAHSPDCFFNEEAEIAAENFIKKYSLNHISDIKIISPNK